MQKHNQFHTEIKAQEMNVLISEGEKGANIMIMLTCEFKTECFNFKQ